MKEEFYYKSCGIGRIHGCCWSPEGKPKAVVQIVHGIAEHIERYDHFANYLTSHGYLVVAEDHMGHGKSVGSEGVQGYFHGGWFSAVADTYQLLENTKMKYPDIPYIIFGHSMGSFMTRTLLCKYALNGPDAAVICGTGWQSNALLGAGKTLGKIACRNGGEKKPNTFLHNMTFGGYNRRVEHPRTDVDWLTRDAGVVDAYQADPYCGFKATAGLMKDLAQGLTYIQQRENLEKMRKEMPVFFIAGGDDPVGNYGAGVAKCAQVFKDVGMKYVNVKIYPLGRHEILNEINKSEVYEDVLRWINAVVARNTARERNDAV